MSIAIVGRKLGMTRVFTESGESVPVTVIECTPNRIAQVRNEQTEGYRAVQVAVGEVKPSRVNKPLAGHFRKAGLSAGRRLVELRLDQSEGADLAVGGDIGVDRFKDVAAVDVTGISIGKGFAGWQKRWNFAGGRASHGNSLSHRMPGSIGQRQSPGKVWKGMKMAGHLGAERVTVLNLDLVRVDVERNLLLIKGAVPGHKGADVVVRPTVR
ncbi:MAG: 50S ribosomal protein L3 [Gammaproteobacteria bacterium]|nr:50S ribosomal protein L3 [Gammaproteobacteria bacterium]